MKIAILGLRMTVGIRLIVETLGQALVRAGHEVVFVGDREYGPPRGITSFAVSGHSYTSMAVDALRPGLYRSVLGVLRRHEPDLCYFISVHPAVWGLARRIRKSVRSSAGRAPSIATHIHDPVPHPGPVMPAILLSQHLQVRAADRVVVYGEQLKKQVLGKYRVPERKVIVIKHGASRPPRNEPPDAAEPRWFSFLGRIEPYKGLDVFLDAAIRVRRTNPTAEFFVGGVGELRRYRSAFDELGGAVSIANREVSNEETDRVMRRSWAVVLPYKSATQSGVIPVAYWNGAPVIASDVGAIEEVVEEGETGFLVPPGDAAVVADRMNALFGDVEGRRRMGARAFDFYDRCLRWEAIGEELLSHLLAEP